MRRKTQSGKVVSSHSSACGASSLVTKARIDSRSWSCSSVKMKCLRWEAWSGLRTVSAVAMAASYRGAPKSKQWHFLLSARRMAGPADPAAARMSEREFDVVILGAGPAGEVCAGRLGESGLSVAMWRRT